VSGLGEHYQDLYTKHSAGYGNPSGFNFLPIGATFDFVDGPNESPDRYKKVSPRKYASIKTGVASTIPCVSDKVYHIELVSAEVYSDANIAVSLFLATHPNAFAYSMKCFRDRGEYESRGEFEAELFKALGVEEKLRSIGLERHHIGILRHMIFEPLLGERG
jgi:hypothetical protein